MIVSQVGKSLHRKASEQHIMAGGGAASPAGNRRSPRQTASPVGGTNAPAQFRGIQGHVEGHPTPDKSGVHAYRIPRAVRADVCASFGRHTQGSYYSDSSVWRVLPAVLVRCLLLWLLRCSER